MMYLSLYHEHYATRYAPRGIASWIFYIICLLIVLVIPFIIGLAMQNFWIQDNFFHQMPDVSFTGRCAVHIVTVRGMEYLWTCSDLFNEQLMGTSFSIQPFFSYNVDDADYDGRMDNINFLMSFPIQQQFEESLYGSAAAGGIEGPGATIDAIQTIEFLPEFTYRIHHYLIKVNMTGAPLLSYTAPPPSLPVDNTNPATEAFSGGPVALHSRYDLLFHTTESLINSPYVHYTHTYTSSPLEEVGTRPADLANLRLFAGIYAQRNQSLVARNYLEAAGGLGVLTSNWGYERSTPLPIRGLWEDLDSLNGFTWLVQMRIPVAEIPYVPSYAEVLKWAWVQYFVIAYLIQWFLWWVRGVIVKLGLLDTRAIYTVFRKPYT